LGVAPGSRDLYELLESVIESAPIIEDHPGFERVLEDVERRMDAGGFKSEPEPVQSDDEDDDDGDSDDDDSDDDLDEELSSDDDADDEEEEAPSRSRTTRRSASTAAASTTTRRRAAVVEEEPEEEEDEEFAEDEPDVLEVRKLLKGRNVLFVGGDKREDVAEELKSGFSLKSLTWVALKDDESLDILEEKIEDINPAIVLVGTRGVGSQIKSIQRLCTNADKPMVKLSSYSAQRVATQILAQASDQLD